MRRGTESIQSLETERVVYPLVETEGTEKTEEVGKNRVLEYELINKTRTKDKTYFWMSV